MLDNCRICLKLQPDTPNTSPISDTAMYHEELFFCVPEIDWETNVTPSLICCNCVRNLKAAAHFRRLCLESHKIRLGCIERLNNAPAGQEDLGDKVGSKLQLKLVCETESDVSTIINESANDDDVSSAGCENEIEPKEDKSAAQIRTSRGSLNAELSNGSKLLCIEQDDFCSVTKKNYPELNENNDDIQLYVPSRQDRTCIFCNCIFSKYTTLTNHIRSIHTFEKCFKCEFCGEGFTNSEILSRHKNRHTGERKYVCSYCGKKFFTNSDLNHHVQRHQNKRNYKCSICENKSFNTANSLRTHKLVVHTNPSEWKHLCSMCGRKCVTQASLTIHLKRHSNEKDFVCHLCSKKFCTKSELSKHIASHSNMRLHKCEICNQEYKDRKVMERHLTKKHGIGNAKIVERAKKYACTICPKKFIGKRQLEKHLRSHNGVRPFKCELCEQAFVCSSYIKGHMRSKHAMDV